MRGPAERGRGAGRALAGASFALLVAESGAAVSDGRGLLQCSSDVYVGRMKEGHRKGITLDDTTLRYCTRRIPDLWPNTEAEIRSIRMFRSWAPDWPEAHRESAWSSLIEYAKWNGVKILMAAPVTCDEDADEKDWALTKNLMRQLGAKNIMGVAIGNEPELLYQSSSKSCIENLWDKGRIWQTFQKRVKDIDQMGMSELPVTTVFTAKILYDGYPFANIKGEVLANDFFKNATAKFGSRFVFTFNVYPYFDPGLRLDEGSTSSCNGAIERAATWDPHSLGPDAMRLARQRIKALTGVHSTFWIGEVGWSSPAAVTLTPAMQACSDFSSLATLEKFYKGFVSWDMSLGDDMPPPDHVFFFTMRNALNYGIQEYFGLMTTCEISECKIEGQNFTEVDALRPPIKAVWLQLGFAMIASSVLLFTVGVAIVVIASKKRSKRMVSSSALESDTDED